MIDKYLNKITCGDCYELIKELPDKCVDCIYTDPPYEFHSGVGKSGMFRERVLIPHNNIQGTVLTEGINQDILREFVRVMKHINIFIWCNKTQILEYLQFFQNENTNFEILTWHKTNPLPLTSNTWLPDTEYCLVFREKGLSLNDGYDLKRKYYISSANKEDKDNFEHPTIKPSNLVKKHLLHTTQEGDVVLDCFMGSGTTAIACKEIGRQFIGFEISEKWCKIANDRLENIDANGQMSFFAR